MKISNGTTELEFLINRLDDNQAQESGKGRTSGGLLRQTITGYRFIGKERVRVTGAEWKALLDLLTDFSTTYFYTPTLIPTHIDSSKFPMAVRISPPTRVARHGPDIYIVEFGIEGVEYTG